MSSARFIALHCGDEAQALIENHPNAFLLLTQIAMRAKWKDCPITGMKAGEALIGDWHKAGLHSPKAYQVAKERLEKCQLATFQGGNRGTRATLIDSRIFSVSNGTRGTQGGIQGEAGGNLGGTNHKDTQKTLTQKRGSLEEVCAFCIEIGLPESDGQSTFYKWEGNGWTNKGAPIKSWKATIRSWKSANYMPSQKLTASPNGTAINRDLTSNQLAI